MSNIQIVLLLCVLLLLYFYLRFFQNRIFNAFFFFVFFVVGIVFIFKPSLTQDVASVFGVGRGVDLVFYLLFMAIFFLFIAIFYKMRHLGKTIIDLVRHRAIDDAEILG